MNTAWTTLDKPGVDKAIERAVERIGASYEWLSHHDLQELSQDARVLVATRSDLHSVAEKPNLLAYRLERDLRDSIKGRRTRRHIVESLFDPTSPESTDGSTCDLTPAVQADEWQLSGFKYSRPEIEALIVALFDPLYGFGFRRRTKAGEIVRSMHHPAAVADIGTAWARCLTAKQRQALFLTVALDVTQEDAAVVLGVSQTNVSALSDRGLLRITAYLNAESTSAADSRELIAA